MKPPRIDYDFSNSSSSFLRRWCSSSLITETSTLPSISGSSIQDRQPAVFLLVFQSEGRIKTVHANERHMHALGFTIAIALFEDAFPKHMKRAQARYPLPIRENALHSMLAV